MTQKKWFQAIVLPALVAALITLITNPLIEIIKDYLKRDPIFAVENAVIEPNQPIIIIAKNSPAKRKKPLDVRWDDIPIKEPATRLPQKNSWEFNIQNNMELPEKYKEDGEHKLEAGFDYKFLNEIIIVLNSKMQVLNEKNGEPNFTIKLAETIKVDPSANLQDTPNSFCVTEDNVFILPDQKKRTIKIFKKVVEGNESFLKLKNSLGPEFGNERFDQPMYCSYDRNISQLGVIDNGTVTKIFVFRKSGKSEFIPIRTFDFKNRCYDMGFTNEGKQLIVSGFTRKTKTESFALFGKNIETGQFSYLIPSYKKYVLKGYNEYNVEFKEKQRIPAIGVRAFIDIHGNDLFFVWEGALRIIHFNLHFQKQEKVFGFETPYYFNRLDETNLTKLTELYIKGNFWALQRIQEMRAYVRNIFATSNYIFIVYETAKREMPHIPIFRLQIYTHDCIFFGDVAIDDPDNLGDSPCQQMWLDKENYELYAFSKKSGNDKAEFSILKYKIKIK